MGNVMTRHADNIWKIKQVVVTKLASRKQPEINGAAFMWNCYIFAKRKQREGHWSKL
jgi:hypothetical protein